MKINIFFILGFVVCLWAQQPGAPEKIYIQSLQKLQRHQVLADSLQARLVRLGKQIDIQKKENIRGEVLSNALNKALRVGNDLDNIQKNIDSLLSHTLRLRRRLYHFYTRQIDSLQGHGDVQNQHLLEILLRKRRSVAPALRFISFDPSLVEHIKTGTGETKLDTLIQNDYLRRALKEVDVNLEIIKKRHADLRQQQTLYREMAAFGNEMQEDNEWGNSVSVSTAPAMADRVGKSAILETSATDNGFPGLTINERFFRLGDVPADSLSGEAYGQMLDEAEKYLMGLQKKIKTKLGLK